MLRPVIILCVSILWTIHASQASGQAAATLTGRVTDESGQPLIGVSVGIAAAGLESLTDDQGRYRLVVPTGRVPGLAGC